MKHLPPNKKNTDNICNVCGQGCCDCPRCVKEKGEKHICAKCLKKTPGKEVKK